MEGFIALTQSIWNKYRLELIFLLIGIIISISSLLIYLTTTQSYSEDQNAAVISGIDNSLSQQNQIDESKIYIDIAGAVVKPDVYQLNIGARLQDVIHKAGGLTDEADEAYFQRNFNQAKLLEDQEKVYIPSYDEINAGYFTESTKIIDHWQSNSSNSSGITPMKGIDINSASSTELDSLSGIGEVTAKKIITNRPYSSINELLTKKIVGESVFNKIKEQIVAN